MMQVLRAIRGRLRRGEPLPHLAPVPPRPPGAPRGRRTLVAGWFSYPQWGATAGDIIARDLVTDWLRQASHDVDVANAPPFDGGVDWRAVDPHDYDHVVFVCGPFPRTRHADQFLERFRGSRTIGVNLTMIESAAEWQPFDLLWERDSDRTVRPDITLLSAVPAVPVIGVCLVEPQWEYTSSAHAAAEAAIGRLTRSREMALVRIDTRLDRGGNPLRTPAEVESLIARMDAVITTRLHGTVLSIKSGVPPLVIDPVAGGAKVLRQAERLDWPVRFVADALDDAKLEAALDWCLSASASQRVLQCRASAYAEAASMRDEFIAAMQRSRVES